MKIIELKLPEITSETVLDYKFWHKVIEDNKIGIGIIGNPTTQFHKGRHYTVELRIDFHYQLYYRIINADINYNIKAFENLFSYEFDEVEKIKEGFILCQNKIKWMIENDRI